MVNFIVWIVGISKGHSFLCCSSRSSGEPFDQSCHNCVALFCCCVTIVLHCVVLCCCVTTVLCWHLIIAWLTSLSRSAYSTSFLKSFQMYKGEGGQFFEKKELLAGRITNLCIWQKTSKFNRKNSLEAMSISLWQFFFFWPFIEWFFFYSNHIFSVTNFHSFFHLLLLLLLCYLQDIS